MYVFSGQKSINIFHLNFQKSQSQVSKKNSLDFFGKKRLVFPVFPPEHSVFLSWIFCIFVRFVNIFVQTVLNNYLKSLSILPPPKQKTKGNKTIRYITYLMLLYNLRARVKSKERAIG